MQPGLHAHPHMPEGVVGEDESDGQQHRADRYPADPFGRDVEHAQHCAEDEQRGAEVLLDHQHADADDPDQQDRAHIPGARQFQPEHVLARGGEQITLGDQHPREEDDEQDLRELTGLNTEAGQSNPDLGAVHLGEPVRQHGREGQRGQTDQAERIGVAGQRAVVPQQNQQARENHHPQPRPQHLLVGIGGGDGL